MTRPIIFPKGRRGIPGATGAAGATASGTFQPFVKGDTVSGNGTYTASEGDYLLVGDLVFFSGRVIWTSLGGADGAANIGGLPFACRSGTRNRTGVQLPWYNSLAAGSSVEFLSAYTNPGKTELKLFGAVNAYEGINQVLTCAQLSETGELYFSGIYRRA